MTELLYQQDSYMQRFTARVVSVEGNAVELSQTALYAEAGGQNSDTGTLTWQDGTCKVTFVKKQNGVVWHKVSGDVPEVGTEVSGVVDWQQRFCHMQRHTGEHLLAQAFLRVNPEYTVQAVSLRSSECTLDFAGSPSTCDAQKACDIVQQAMYRNLPITCFVVAEHDISHYPLRRSPKVTGHVRLVGVLDDTEASGYWEMSACGGTHLQHTAEVGVIAVTKLEKVAGGLTRVFFVCGQEAYQMLNQSYQHSRAIASSLSCAVDMLPERIAALQHEHLELKKALAQNDELLSRAVLAAVDQPYTVIQAHSPEYLKALSKTALGKPDFLGVFYTSDGKLAVASTCQHSAKDVLDRIIQPLAGKGGGKPDLAQGSAAPENLPNQIHKVLVALHQPEFG